jgi:hypothetical protein
MLGKTAEEYLRTYDSVAAAELILGHNDGVSPRQTLHPPNLDWAVSRAEHSSDQIRTGRGSPVRTNRKPKNFGQTVRSV